MQARTRQERRARKREAARAGPADPDRRKRVAALLAGLFPAVMVFFQVTGFNGPYYWRWRYGHDSVLPFLLLAIPAGFLIFWAQRRWEKAESTRRSAIGLLVLAQLFLLFSYISLAEHGFDSIKWRLQNPDITSYYTEAAAIHNLSHWVAHYDQLLPHMRAHAQTHPPGPILYFYAWVRALGPHAALLWSGVFIGLLACLAVPAIYLFTRYITQDPEAGFVASILWAILPGIIVIFPSMDQVYPVLTIVLLYLWWRAAIEGRFWCAAGFTPILFGALLFTHSFLLLGAHFVLSAGLAIAWRAAPWKKTLAAGAIGFALLCGLFASVYWISGYNHLAALRQSMRNQEALGRLLQRPYHLAIFWDLYDYFLASGWIMAGILAVAIARWKAAWGAMSTWLRIFVPASLATVLIVDLSGLLRTEAARVWLFLQPLVIPLVAVELRQWSRNWRLAAYGSLLLALAVIRSRMHFL